MMIWSRMYNHETSQGPLRIELNTRSTAGARRRWRDAKRRQTYEEDTQHGELEKYNRKLRHMGTVDPATGEIIKPPVKGRQDQEVNRMTALDMIKLGIRCTTHEAAEEFAEALVDKWHEDLIPGDLHDVLGLTRPGIPSLDNWRSIAAYRLHAGTKRLIRLWIRASPGSEPPASQESKRLDTCRMSPKAPNPPHVKRGNEPRLGQFGGNSSADGIFFETSFGTR